MAKREAVIIGAGGHGREVFNWLSHAAPSDLSFLGFLDDGSPDAALLSRLGARHLGPVQMLRDMPGVEHYVGIGTPSMRRQLADKAVQFGSAPAPPVIHPQASVGADVILGAGCVLAPGAVVTTNVRIGRHTHLSSNTVVGHDAVLGDYVSVYPGATVSGNVHIEDGVLIGTNATVIQGLQIGADAVLGAGAAAVTDIEPGAVAVGVPARPRN